jgi:hypothetical protein
MAMLFEMGCIFHSFIIGISLGVISDDRTTVGIKQLHTALDPDS